MALFPLRSFITNLFSFFLYLYTMIPHRRRELQAESQFTLCKPNPRASGHLKSSDGIESGTCSERIQDHYGSFGKSDDHKCSAWQRRTLPNLPGTPDDEFEFGWLAKGDGDDSDVASPPLWKKAGSAESSPIHCGEDRFSYPTSQARTIARYRQEMLDMVRDVPESDHELSFRDLVESPRTEKLMHETSVKGRESSKDKDKTEEEQDREENMKKGKRRMSRKESTDTGGLLQKMFCPSSLMGRRKSFAGSKPMQVEGEKGGQGDCWRKKALREEQSSSSSSNSGSRSRKMIGCCSFFGTNKNRAMKN